MTEPHRDYRAVHAVLQKIHRGAVTQNVRRLLAACDIPVFLVTHDRAEALSLGDELVVIKAPAVHLIARGS